MVRRRFGWRVAAWIAIVIGSLGLARPAAAGQDAAAPTFTKDVAPIFQEKCQACHRAGYIAPMSLVTYEEVRPWVRSIKGRIASRQMPPWHIDRTVGIQKFKNDRSLTDEELDTVVRWIDAGAPRGDPKDMPRAEGVRPRTTSGICSGYLRRAARPRDQVDAVHDAGARAGPLVEARGADRADRGSLDPRHRDSAVDGARAGRSRTTPWRDSSRKRPISSRWAPPPTSGRGC